jgi:hypothetical protein
MSPASVRSPHGAIRAFTPVFDGLWRNAGAAIPDCAECIIGRRFAPTRWLHPGYDTTLTVDTILQIRVFRKLKLTNCARPGNRAGLFRAHWSVGWAERLSRSPPIHLATKSVGGLRAARRQAPVRTAIGGANRLTQTAAEETKAPQGEPFS